MLLGVSPGLNGGLTFTSGSADLEGSRDAWHPLIACSVVHID